MDASLAENIIKIANTHPNKPALILGSNTISYQALLQNASNVARALGSFEKTSETSTERFVGVFIDKRFDAVEAILGSLLASQAYVPLDIKNPLPRLEYIISDCELRTFITTPDLLDKLLTLLNGSGQPIDIVVICDQDDGIKSDIVSSVSNHRNIRIHLTFCVTGIESLPDNDQDKEKPIASTNSLAAVLYTSGSTGSPKGVMIEHAAIETFVDWASDYFDISDKDCAISHAPLNFDLSLFDLFVSLSVGASVLLVPDNMSGNPRYIVNQMQRYQVTVWQSVPSALSLLVKYGKLENYGFEFLRHILFAGEKMPITVLKALIPHFKTADFHNVYGATETNDSFIYSFKGDADFIPDELPIGHPLPYVTYEIRDRDGKAIAETNIEGALFVRSTTMMKSYRHDALTKGGNSQDYYATNDVVKRLPDGSLLYRGRLDDVVKTNGYRVNLLEIELALKTHPHIREAAVYALPSESIGNHIVATIARDVESDLNMLTLKQFCAGLLPVYAIPHTFKIQTDDLPKTSSGKINKLLLKNERGRYVKTAQPETIYS